MTDNGREELAAQLAEFWRRAPQPEVGRALALLRRQFDTRRSFIDGMAEVSGEHVGADDSLVYRWERGDVNPTGRYRRMFARVCAAQVEEMSTKGRREFLREMVLIGGGLISLPYPIGTKDGQRADNNTTERYGQAEHFRLIRMTLADSDNQLGPWQVIPAATSQVQAIQLARRDALGSDLRDLLEVQTQFADLLGWLHQDIADFQASQYWMDRALEWAHVTGDYDSVAFVLARKSQLAGDMQDPIEAVDIAEAAMELAGTRSRRLVAIAATYGAHGHALRGNRGACDRLYDHARSLLDRADPDEHWWGSFFDAPYIEVQRAHSLAVLGEHRKAAEGFLAAIGQLQNGYHRDRGVYLARGAVAYAGVGEFEHAAKLGMQALAVGAETDSHRIFTELECLDDALSARRSVPEVARFHAALTDSTPRQPDQRGSNR